MFARICVAVLLWSCISGLECGDATCPSVYDETALMQVNHALTLGARRDAEYDGDPDKSKKEGDAKSDTSQMKTLVDKLEDVLGMNKQDEGTEDGSKAVAKKGEQKDDKDK